MWRAATAEEDAALTSARARRIAKELEGIKAAPVENVTAGPLDEADITVWQALLAGPPDSPYEGGEMAARWPAPRGSRGRGADAEEGAEAHGCARARATSQGSLSWRSASPTITPSSRPR
jgi:hypothetical protein